MLGACGGGSGDSGNADKLAEHNVGKTLEVTSGAFDDGAPIPEQYTCDGQDRQPSLTWTGVPTTAKELAVVVDDPDAPGGTFVHWVVFGLDPSVTQLPEGGPVPDGAKQAENSGGKAAWMGPCPPPGKVHHYRFTVYALNKEVDAKDGAGKDDVLGAIRGAAVAKGTLTGTFART